MYDPRRCDACHSDTELQDACYDLTIGAHTLAIDYRGRLCRGCARQLLRRRPRHPDDRRTRLLVEILLGHRFGEPVKVLWLQFGEHRVSALCRRRTRLESARPRIDPPDKARRPGHRRRRAPAADAPAQGPGVRVAVTPPRPGSGPA